MLEATPKNQSIEHRENQREAPEQSTNMHLFYSRRPARSSTHKIEKSIPPLIPITMLFLWPLITGALLSSAQYSPLQACDSIRLIRCQQDVLRDMQTVSFNAASSQHPISGPPYSPKSYQEQLQGQLLANPSTCRQVRSNLDCLLQTTPACYELGIQTAHNTDIILRAKRFLGQNGCNEPDATWQSTLCFQSPEVRSCEEVYGFTNINSVPLLISNATACFAYHKFKHCVGNHLRLNCKVHEMDMANEYLIDRASDLSWRCPVNGTGTSSNYALKPSSYSALDPYLSPSAHSNYANYDQRPLPTYVGSSGSFNSLRDTQPWERFRNPLDDSTRFGMSRHPIGHSGLGTGEVFDRMVAAGNGFDVDSSDCPVKAAPYARECEDTLMEQHRQARDSRDGNELQRRMCCALLQYRDCISRVVLDRCADSSPTAVEILMGVRRREMTFTCRGFNRDVCSGASRQVLMGLQTILLAAILAAYMALKQQFAVC